MGLGLAREEELEPVRFRCDLAGFGLGLTDGEWRYRRLRAAIGTEIWRRVASQVIACWPDREEAFDC